MLVQHLS